MTEIPPTALPCTVEKNGSTYFMTGTIKPEEEEEEDRRRPPFILFLKRKLQDKKNDPLKILWIFHNGNPPTEEQIEKLEQSLKKEELTGYTDASTKDGISTASFQFQNKEGETVLQGEVLVPGIDEIQCSHRGEMGGAAAALTYLQTIIEYRQIKHGRVNFGCDSDNVVNVGLTQKQATSSMAEHYDLVRQCQEARRNMSPIELVPVHV